MRTLLLIVVLAAGVWAQDAVQADLGYVLPAGGRNTGPNVKLVAAYNHQGEGAQVYFLRFTSICYGGCVFRSADLVLEVDGEELKLEQGRRSLNYNRPLKETLTFNLTPAQMGKLAQSKKVLVRLGSYEAALTSKQVQGLAGIWEKSTASGAGNGQEVDKNKTGN